MTFMSQSYVLVKKVTLSKTFVFFTSLFVCLLAQYCYFSRIHGLWNLWFFNFSNYSADALLFCSVLLLLPRKQRGYALLWPWLTSVYLLASTVYYRYSYDLLSFRIIFSSSSYNDLVFGAAGSLLRFSDLIWLVFPLIPTATLMFYHRHDEFDNVGIMTKTMILIAAIVIFVGNYVAIAGYRAGWLRDIGDSSANTEKIIRQNFRDKATQINFLNQNGHVLFVIDQISDMLYSSAIDLDDDTRQKIEGYMNSCSGSEFVRTENKENLNLIFIVVESLDSYAVDMRVGDCPLCPVLDSLSRLEGTIYAPILVSQIAEGSSADGQLMYNTGLHPIVKGYTSMEFGSNKYISLASLLDDYVCEEIIGEERAVWNHAETSRSYGYTVLHDRNEVSSDPTRNASDMEIFQYAIKRVQDLTEPFMLFVTTLTSHFPYDAKNPDDNFIKGNDTKSRYLRTVRYFDSCLGDFLKQLRESGKADNTVVIIASDHDAPMDIVRGNTVNDILFLAVNTPFSRKIAWPVGQIDVFPTVLDIMGISSKWRGVGHSFVKDSIGAAIDRNGNIRGNADKAKTDSLRFAIDISDKIIRSDYFKIYGTE